MPTAIYDDVLRFLHHACGLKGGGDKPDRELVERYLGHEEAAFSLLMQRHGPMILGICRRLAADPHSAEDGFQATFMVLIRQAASIRKKESLAPWLHGVARRLVLKARAKAAANRRREERTLPMASPDPLQELTVRELRSCLDEEIAQLPVKYQTPILLCYFECKSYSQAAQEIGCPKTTFTNRLNRGLQLLRRQLSRRGITLAGAALATALTEAAAAPPLPAILAVNTMKAATLLGGSKAVASGCLTASAVALAEEALTGMMLVKGKIVLMVLALGLAVGGVGWAGFTEFTEAGQTTQGVESGKRNVLSITPGGADKPRVDANGDPLPEGAMGRLGAARFRHEGNAIKVSFSPDGKNLSSFSLSGLICWDARTGLEKNRLTMGSAMQPSQVDFSPDGNTLAVASEDRANEKDPMITLWDLRTGKKNQTLAPPKKEYKSIGHVGFTPSGKYLAAIFYPPSDSSQTEAVVFDLVARKIKTSISGKGLHCLAVSPDEKHLAAVVYAESDSTRVYRVQMYDFISGELLRVCHELPEPTLLSLRKEFRGIFAITFSLDGKTLAFGGKNSIFIIDPQSGKLITELKGNLNHPRALAFTPDGKKLISCETSLYPGDGNSPSIWDTGTGKLLHNLDTAVCPNGNIGISPDGQTVAIGTRTSRVQQWDIASGKELFADFQTQGHNSSITSLAFSPDGNKLASADQNGPVFLWDKSNWKNRVTLPSNAQAMSFSRDGNLLAMTSYFFDGVQIWDVPKVKMTLELPDGRMNDAIRSIFSANSKNLITLESREVSSWDLKSGKREKKWAIPDLGLPDDIFPRPSLAMNGKSLFAAFDDKFLRIFDIESNRKQQFTFPEREFFNQNTLFPDGRVLASAGTGENSEISLWETLTCKQIARFKGHKGAVASFGVLGRHNVCISWSPDGRFLASGDRRFDFQLKPMEGQSVRLWDAAIGMELACFGKLNADVNSLTFSPDGSILVAGLGDGTILIYDVKKYDPKFLPPPNLTKADLESIWTSLIDTDAGKAHMSLWKFVGAPKISLPFLRDHLKPVPIADPNSIQKWIADLDSSNFAVRQEAAKELEKISDQIQMPLQKVMKDNITLEARRRLEQIVNHSADVPGQKTIRTIRAIMALERIGIPEARGVLENLARGAPGARETEEARGSVERLIRRGK